MKELLENPVLVLLPFIGFVMGFYGIRVLPKGKLYYWCWPDEAQIKENLKLHGCAFRFSLDEGDIP